MIGTSQSGGSIALPARPHSIREARQIAQPAQYSPALTDKFYRALSIYPSYWLSRTSVTPNQITYFWIALGLIAAIGLDAPRHRYRLAAAFLLQISYLFDYVDGEVARLQDRRSKKGLLLDLLGHGVVKMALFLCLGFHFVGTALAAPALILAFLASIGIVNGNALSSFGVVAGYLAEPGPAPSASVTADSARSFLKKLLTVVALLFESPGIYALILATVAIEKTEWALCFYGVLAPFWLIYHTAKF